MNSFQLTGNAGGTPFMTVDKNGNKIARFSIYQDKRYPGGEKKSDRYTIVLFDDSKRKLASFAEKYIKAGSSLAITGNLHPSEAYETKDGVKHGASVELIATQIEFTGSRPKKEPVKGEEQAATPASEPEKPENVAEEESDEMEVPFS